MADRVQLDAIDIAIVEALQRHGRLANKALAARVGLSPSACHDRVRKLEQDGVIAGYSARIGRNAIDASFEAWICLNLEERSPASLERLRRAVTEEAAIVEAIELAGPFDVLLHLHLPDASALPAFEAKLMRSVGEKSVFRTAVYLSDLKPASLPPLRRASGPQKRGKGSKGS